MAKTIFEWRGVSDLVAAPVTSDTLDEYTVGDVFDITPEDVLFTLVDETNAYKFNVRFKREDRIPIKKKKKSEEANANSSDQPDMSEQMTKNMSLITPIMAVSIAFIAPLGLALYWLMSNVLMIVEKLVINKYVDSKEDKKDA